MTVHLNSASSTKPTERVSSWQSKTLSMVEPFTLQIIKSKSSCLMLTSLPTATQEPTDPPSCSLMEVASKAVKRSLDVRSHKSWHSVDMSSSQSTIVRLANTGILRTMLHSSKWSTHQKTWEQPYALWEARLMNTVSTLTRSLLAVAAPVPKPPCSRHTLTLVSKDRATILLTNRPNLMVPSLSLECSKIRSHAELIKLPLSH